MLLLAKNALKTLLSMCFLEKKWFICIQFIFNILGKELVTVDENASQKHDLQI